ncbi:hypothetical protein TWF506_007698 [Arthrobotrys conoides]|uniref:Uncharacterized protein n=1 Tax=Arthrobotrys conoides TaxID=74498 RepID=A0AAN8NKQ4_9PEZI
MTYRMAIPTRKIQHEVLSLSSMSRAALLAHGSTLLADPPYVAQKREKSAR